MRITRKSDGSELNRIKKARKNVIECCSMRNQVSNSKHLDALKIVEASVWVSVAILVGIIILIELRQFPWEVRQHDFWSSFRLMCTYCYWSPLHRIIFRVFSIEFYSHSHSHSRCMYFLFYVSFVLWLLLFGYCFFGPGRIYLFHAVTFGW